jgi:hypothetical protein
MKVFHVIGEDEDEDRALRAPTAEPENFEIDEEISSYCCDSLSKGMSQSSGVIVGDGAGDGPLLGVAPASGVARGVIKPTCTLVRVSTYASSLNQPTIR